MYLHWMVINIPGSKVDEGQTITSYKGPAPKPGSGVHRYVIVAYEQKSETPMRIDHGQAPFQTTFPCQVNFLCKYCLLHSIVFNGMMQRQLNRNFIFCSIGKWSLIFRFG